MVDWRRTSWGSKKKWSQEASEWGCPVANEYEGRLPSSLEGRMEVFEMYCHKNCGLYAEPSPPWECCPYGQKMAQEVQELLEFEQSK